VTRVAKSSGCALSGFVLVKKVPGTLHFLAKSPGHSFDHQDMNMSHVVHYVYAGNKPSPRRRKVTACPRFHPKGVGARGCGRISHCEGKSLLERISPFVLRL